MAEKRIVRRDVVQIAFETDTSGLKGVESAMSKTKKSASDMSGDMSKTEESIRGVGGAAGGMAKTAASAADGMSKLLLAAGGYKAIGFIKDSFKEAASAAIEFESAMAGVYKTVDGTPEQLQGLSQAVRDMATQIPASTTEIAGVMESAGQLGINTGDIENFTRTMIELGTATNMTADEAASSLARFANVTQMSAENYSNLGSTIVALGNNFATTESEITNMSSYLSSAASLAGFSQTEILGLSTAMLSMGINAEAGGSSMSRLITAMQTAAETGSESLEQFASVAGMTGEQFKNAFTNEPVEALQAFISGLSDVERNGASASVILQQMDLDDIRLSNTIKALASNSGILSSAVETANSAWSENSALTNEAEKRYATLESKLQIMSNSANDLKISIGNALTPALSGLTDAATGALKGLSSFADENQALTAGIMGTVGTVGTLAAGFVTVVPAISAVKTAWKSLDIAMSASKIGLIVGGIALAVGAVAGLTTAFSDAENAVEDYNGTLEECRNEIEQTKAEYDAVVSSFGAQSEAAEELKGQLETLNAQYQKGGGAVAELTARNEENAKLTREIAKSYEDQIKSVDNATNSGLTAAAMLQSISSQAVITNSDLDMMGKYADYLNDTFLCNIEVNYDTRSLTGFDPTSVTDMIIAQAEQNRHNAAIENYTSDKTQNQYIENLKALHDAQKDYESFKAEFEKKQTNFGQLNAPTHAERAEIAEAKQKLEDLEAKYREAESTYESFKNTMEGQATAGGAEDSFERYIDYLDSLERGEKNAGNAADSTKNKITSLSDAYSRQINSLSDYKAMQSDIAQLEKETVAGALQSVSDELISAAQAYDEMYNRAYNSLSSQFGLFEKAEDKVKSLADAYREANGYSSDTDSSNFMSESEAVLRSHLESIESQIQYMQELQEAAATLSEEQYRQQYINYEATKGIQINSYSDLQTFKTQSLNAYDNYIDQIEAKAAQGDQEAQATMVAIGNAAKNGQFELVGDIIGKWAELDESTQSTAQKIAYETSDMQQAMTAAEIVVAMSLMNIGMDAITAHTTGQSIINSLASGINSGMDALEGAVSNMEALVSRALAAKGAIAGGSGGGKVNSPSDIAANGYATGTLSAAPGLALVGEKGPELINFGGGEVVYTADETRRMLAMPQTEQAEAVMSKAQPMPQATEGTSEFVTPEMSGLSEISKALQEISRQTAQTTPQAVQTVREVQESIPDISVYIPKTGYEALEFTIPEIPQTLRTEKEDVHEMHTDIPKTEYRPLDLSMPSGEADAPVSNNTSNTTNNKTFAPQFTLNMVGASATEENKKKVQQWVKDAIKQALHDAELENAPVVEI